MSLTAANIPRFTGLGKQRSHRVGGLRVHQALQGYTDSMRFALLRCHKLPAWQAFEALALLGFPQMLNKGMDPTKIRMRYLLGVIVTAVIVAAVLRHFLHVEVGFTRKEILMGALVAAALGIFLTIALFRQRKRS
jgi:hypothetical protein